MVTDTAMPAARASPTRSRTVSTESATDMRWLRALNVSDATTTQFTSSTPAATARSNPRRLRTRPL
jgi:hypothetical protein